MANTDFREMNAVLSQFDRMGTAFYEVYEGKQMKFDSRDFAANEDVSGARTFLEDNLKAILHYGNTALFTIKFYEEINDTKGNGAFKNLKGSNTFKLCDFQDAAITGYWEQKKGLRSSQNAELEEIKEMLKIQQDQITALLAEPDEPDDSEPEAVGGILGALTPIINNPEVQQAIAGKIVDFLNQILPDKKKGMGTQQQTNGQIEYSQHDTDRLNNAVMILLSAGMTVSDFEKLADLVKDPQTFNFYLMQLRK